MIVCMVPPTTIEFTRIEYASHPLPWSECVLAHPAHPPAPYRSKKPRPARARKNALHPTRRQAAVLIKQMGRSQRSAAAPCPPLASAKARTVQDAANGPIRAQSVRNRNVGMGFSATPANLNP